MKREEVVKVAGLMALIADKLEVEYSDFFRMKSDWYDMMLEKEENGQVPKEKFMEAWNLFLSGETQAYLDNDIEAMRKAAAHLVESYDQFVKARTKVEELYKKAKGE